MRIPYLCDTLQSVQKCAHVNQELISIAPLFLTVVHFAYFQRELVANPVQLELRAE